MSWEIKYYSAEEIPTDFYQLEKEIYSEQVLQMKGDLSIPNKHLLGIVVCRDQQLLAKAALYFNPDIVTSRKTLLIGGFESIDDQKVVKQLLSFIENWAIQQGFESIIGPMNGSTWESYRVKIAVSKPFFTETIYPTYYADCFIQNGYEMTAEYESRKATIFPIPEQLSKYPIRKIDLSNLKFELYKLYPLLTESFKSAYLYTDISVDEFVKKYSSIAAYLDEELIWIAEDEGVPIGVVFGIKDYYDSSNEQVIIKTLARNLSPQYKGVGQALVAFYYNHLLSLQYRKVIHAFMRVDNNSVQITSDKFKGEAFAKYALFKKDLG